MHSSRMRTARSLPYGGRVSVQRGVGVSVQGGLCPVRGVSVRETPSSREQNDRQM